MILKYKCHNCNKEFTLPFKANDRGKLNRKPIIKEICLICKYENELIVNRIKAIISPINEYAYVLALLMNVVISILMYYFFDFKTVLKSSTGMPFYALGLIFLIPFMIAKVSIQNDLNAVRIFNRYYV